MLKNTVPWRFKRPYIVQLRQLFFEKALARRYQQRRLGAEIEVLIGYFVHCIAALEAPVYSLVQRHRLIEQALAQTYKYRRFPDAIEAFSCYFDICTPALETPVYI